MRVLISGIVFAIANQVGNHGLTTLGIILVAGGAAFAAFAIRAALVAQPNDGSGAMMGNGGCSFSTAV